VGRDEKWVRKKSIETKRGYVRHCLQETQDFSRGISQPKEVRISRPKLNAGMPSAPTTSENSGGLLKKTALVVVERGGAVRGGWKMAVR